MRLDRSEPSVTESPVATLLVEAGWTTLNDRILMGLCHDVNGRIAALQAMAQLVEMGDPIPSGFGSEVARLEGLSKRLSYLIGDLERAPAPVMVGDILERAIDFHRHVYDRGEGELRLEAEDEPPPVLINEGRCLRLLLLFVDVAARAAGLLGVGVSLQGNREGVKIGFYVSGLDVDLKPLDRVAALDGGSVSLEAGRATLRLPSLSKVRAERAS